ncbi:MAG: DUF4230 domain-containing protein [Chthoniobacterales bacterium]
MLMKPEAIERRRKFSWPAAFTLTALLLAALVAFIFVRMETWPSRTAKGTADELERVGRDLRSAFIEIARLQPRITVNNRVYVERTTASAELALLSRQIEVEHELLHTWAGSTKRVKVHGTFAVRAGFDLQHDVSVDLGQNEIVVQLPHATILGAEQTKIEVLALENGFWNRISPDDLQSELAALPQLAREKAAQSGLATEAEQSIQRQLTAKLHATHPVRVIFGSAEVKR